MFDASAAEGQNLFPAEGTAGTGGATHMVGRRGELMTTSANGRRISTHEATVKTAAVEVKTLTISGKQVTLAMFRQFLKEPLLDERSGDLLGVPWGTVNYFWGGCTEGNHLHVVWQKGLELRRCCLESSLSSQYHEEALPQLAQQYVHAKFASGWRPSAEGLDAPYYHRHQTPFQLMIAGETYTVDLWPFCVKSRYGGGLRFDEQKIHADVPPCSVDEAYHLLSEAVAQRNQFHARWKAHYEAIRQVDQRFIAV
jgi:hypothetical protein